MGFFNQTRDNQMKRRVSGKWTGLRSFGVLAATLLAGCETGPADLVLRNGTFVTVDPNNPAAQAIAVRGDKIVAVGSDADIAPYVGTATEARSH
jgi:hypothetical protein